MEGLVRTDQSDQRCKLCQEADKLACINLKTAIILLCGEYPYAKDLIVIVQGIFCSRIMDKKTI